MSSHLDSRLALLKASMVFVWITASGIASAQGVAPVPVESVVLRSASQSGSSRDPGTTCWKVPASGFVLPLNAAEFANARAGFPAFVLSSYPRSYTYPLPADPAARWINETGSSSSGNSVLYAIPFTLEKDFTGANLEIYFAVDNTLGFSPGNAGLYLNEQPLLNSLGGTHESVSHFFYASVEAKVRRGANTLYILSHDTGLDGGILFSVHIRTYRGTSPPILNASVIGPPVVRNDRPAEYALELVNSTLNPIDAALVCVFVSDTSASLTAKFPLATPFPTTGGPVNPTIEGRVVGDELAFGFLATGIPANSTDSHLTFDLTFRLHDRN